MPAPPATPLPTISPGEMQLLLSRTGLVLNPGQVADLVLAWRQLAGLITIIPHDRPLADDLAVVFRVTPPADIAPAPRSVRAARPKPKPKAKAKSKAKAKAGAKRKTAAKRRTPAKLAPRKRRRRGR